MHKFFRSTSVALSACYALSLIAACKSGESSADESDATEDSSGASTNSGAGGSSGSGGPGSTSGTDSTGDSGGSGGNRNTSSGNNTSGNNTNNNSNASNTATSTTGTELPPGLTLSPAATTLIHGAEQPFRCVVTGFDDTSCRFSITEGEAGGVIDDEGNYTAPAVDGTYHVVAESNADDSFTQTATIRVVAPGAPGEWINVTPAGVSLDYSYNSAGNFGVQDVVADPARPSDLYAFICYQGVWRSQDYGMTWEKVSTGQNSDTLDAGRPWTAAIDPNPNRDPETAPALYTVNGYGPQLGLYKSTDFGVNWVHSTLTGPDYDEAYQDVYALDINPYDSSHILAGYHEVGGIAESFDAGATWRLIQPQNGRSLYPFFIDTGDPATTATTWVVIPQHEGSEQTVSTQDSGASWTNLGVFAHAHGGTQIFNGGNGVVYLSGTPGVHESTDAGQSMTMIRTINENGITGTPNYLYAFSSGASSGTIDPVLARAPRSNVTEWTEIPAPAGMSNGPKRVAVTYDGTHHVLVSGNWLAGIWRYVEP